MPLCATEDVVGMKGDVPVSAPIFIHNRASNDGCVKIPSRFGGATIITVDFVQRLTQAQEESCLSQVGSC